MKKNWIKGLDRVAVVIAVPIAIFFGIYMSNKFNADNTLFSCRPQIAMLHYTMSPKVEDVPQYVLHELYWEQSDTQIIQGLDQLNKSRAPEIAKGLKKGFRLVDLKVISPGILTRIIVGFLWAMGAGIISVLAVSASTRGFPKTFRWLQSGFAEEGPKNKKK
jgi:hypothetical protein